MQTNKKASFGFSVVVIIVAIILIAVSFFQQILSEKNTEKVKGEIASEVVKEIVLQKPSCPSTTESFYALRDSGQIVTLARDLNTYGKNSVFINPKITIVRSTGVGSQIACGYLYVKAYGANKRPLQTQWEHPFVKPGQFGGHLETKNSIIPAKSGKSSEFLYGLSKMEYKTTNSSSEISLADWSALLNVSNRIQFEIALNTIDESGNIEEVSIVYQCWSPETGKITHDCRLSVE